MGLYCFDCGVYRSKFGGAVVSREQKHIIGWSCKKCFMKRQVVGKPKFVGWRKAYKDLVALRGKNT